MTAVDKLARAIVLAAAEHGASNSFSPAELLHYGGPHPVAVGRIVRHERDALNEALKLAQLRVVEYAAPKTLTGNLYRPAMLTVVSL